MPKAPPGGREIRTGMLVVRAAGGLIMGAADAVEAVTPRLAAFVLLGDDEGTLVLLLAEVPSP